MNFVAVANISAVGVEVEHSLERKRNKLPKVMHLQYMGGQLSDGRKSNEQYYRHLLLTHRCCGHSKSCFWTWRGPNLNR